MLLSHTLVPEGFVRRRHVSIKTKSRRNMRRQSLTSQRRIYGYLFSPYRRNQWWWEIWNTLRKALAVVVKMILFSEAPAIQIWAALALSSVSLAVFVHSYPYHDESLNSLEHMALMTEHISFFFAVGVVGGETALHFPQLQRCYCLGECCVCRANVEDGAQSMQNNTNMPQVR